MAKELLGGIAKGDKENVLTGILLYLFKLTMREDWTQCTQKNTLCRSVCYGTWQVSKRKESGM